MNNLFTVLGESFPDLKFESEAMLAPFTAIKIGGPAEVLVTIQESATLIAVIQFCHEQHIPVTLLGWGANTLIADRGLRGLVIRNQTKELKIEDGGQSISSSDVSPSPRHDALSDAQDFSSLDYQEEEGTPRVSVTAASGWPLASLIATLFAQGVTGLQWYSRIPATVGGAVVNNIHGGTHFISEVIDSVHVLTADNNEIVIPRAACAFDYDYSRFHGSGETIITVQLQLWRGDVTRAQQTVGEWARRKSLQPQQSLGCTFQNISSADQKKLTIPTPSAGYIIDQLLQLKGKRVGGAQISSQHAAFIENAGEASAQDYLTLALEVYRAAQSKLGITLKPEIFFRGFTKLELKELATGNSL